MRKYKTLALAALLSCAPLAFAQPPTCQGSPIATCRMGTPAGTVQIKPQAVPTSAAIVTSYDAYLKTVTVSNTTAAALTFTLADRQATPVAAMQAVSIAANTSYVIVFPDGYYCPYGFTVTASGAGLNFYAVWKQ